MDCSRILGADTLVGFLILSCCKRISRLGTDFQIESWLLTPNFSRINTASETTWRKLYDRNHSFEDKTHGKSKDVLQRTTFQVLFLKMWGKQSLNILGILVSELADWTITGGREELVGVSHIKHVLVELCWRLWVVPPLMCIFI